LNRLLPGTYLTDGRALLWVIERLSGDTVLVENATTGEELEMGEADLAGFRIVNNKEQDDQQQS